MIDDSLRDLTDYEREIIANVREYGCHLTSVVAGEEDAWEPPFTYSTGFLETVDQPEVIVFGLSSAMHAAMINNLLRLCRGGLDLIDGARIGGLLREHDVVARAVAPEHIRRDNFNSAIWYEKRRTGQALDQAIQLVWPGAQDGLFPWDEGSSQDVRDLQPALYERSMIS